MTAESRRIPQEPHRTAPTASRRVVFALMSLFFLGLLLRNAQVAIDCLSEGLRVCARTVIPSLFPFMVLSELIVSSGAARLLGRLLSAPCRLLFGVRGEGVCPILLGFLCGFPVGTKSAVSLYQAGRLSAGDLSYLLTFCNVPSSAFLISAVGVSLFGSHAFGVALYVSTLLSALLAGLLFRLLRRRKKDESVLPPPSAPVEVRRGISLFTDAVTSAAFAILRICAFVIFFSALVGTLEYLLQALSLPKPLCAFCCGLFELTGGVLRACEAPPALAPVLCAFCAGWSGLSVHFQIMSLCDGLPLSFRPYLLSKFLQALLNIPLFHIFLRLI